VTVKFDLKPLGRSGGGQKPEPMPMKALPSLTTSSPTVRQPSRREIAAIIAAASAAAAAQPPPSAPEESENLDHKPSLKPQKKSQTKEEKEANKEKRLLKLVGSVVVKYMSKYQKQMDTAQFKKHAKEVRWFFSYRALVQLLNDLRFCS